MLLQTISHLHPRRGARPATRWGFIGAIGRHIVVVASWMREEDVVRDGCGHPLGAASCVAGRLSQAPAMGETYKKGLSLLASRHYPDSEHTSVLTSAHSHCIAYSNFNPPQYINAYPSNSPRRFFCPPHPSVPASQHLSVLVPVNHTYIGICQR